MTSRCFIAMLLNVWLLTLTLVQYLEFHRTDRGAFNHFHCHCPNVWCRIPDGLGIDFEKIQHLLWCIGFSNRHDLLHSSFAGNRSGNRHMIVRAFEMKICFIWQQLTQMLYQSYEVNSHIEVEDRDDLIIAPPKRQICCAVSLSCDIDLPRT